MLLEFDRQSLIDLSDSISPKYHLLSERTVQLCLSSLGFAGERWLWTDLTDSEWYQVSSWVAEAESELMTAMLTGMILPYAGSTVPDGFLICDGSAVSRDDYARLFDLIGETYGAGDGSTTFNLPDLRGRAAVGRDPSQTEFDVLGETGGEKAHILTVSELPTHSHSEITAVAALINGGLEAPAAAAIPGTGSTGSVGSDQAHNNLQPYQVINFIIKT